MDSEATARGQTAHLQAVLCRPHGPMPQMRTAQQGSIRSSCLKHGRFIELTCCRSDLCWLSAATDQLKECLWLPLTALVVHFPKTQPTIKLLHLPDQ